MARIKPTFPKIIFFDWNGTLSTSLFWEQMSFESHPYHSYHKLLDKWLFSDNRELINPWMRGEITMYDICAKLSAAIGLEKQLLLDELRVSCESMVFVSEDIASMLLKLKRQGILLVVATDNMDTFREFTIPGMRLDRYFDDYLVSFDLHRLKRETDSHGRLLFFDGFMRSRDLNYKDAIMIDDGVDKEEVMKRAGLEVVMVSEQISLSMALREYIK